MRELNEFKTLQIRTLTQEVSGLKERAAQWEQEKVQLLGQIVPLERKIESLEQDLEGEYAGALILTYI